MRLLKHPLVDCDIEEAALWYHLRNSAVAVRLIDEARAAMRIAAQNPLQFTIRFADVRRVRLPSFPHSVYFRLLGDSVCILALAHGGRDLQTLLTGRKPPS